MSSSRTFLHSRRYKWINLYPPLLGAGIRVLHKQSDDYTIKVQLKLTRLNLNAVGTHFGGSLYAMCDPFFMLILLEHMGRDYIVWDKSASIRFRKPGKGRMLASFRLSEEQIESIRQQLETQEKAEPSFLVEVKDENGELVAEVQKLLHVRKKRGR